MKLGSHKRSKLGQLPGDCSIQAKEKLLRGPLRSKAYKDVLRSKERARLKERTRNEVE